MLLKRIKNKIKRTFFKKKKKKKKMSPERKKRLTYARRVAKKYDMPLAEVEAIMVHAKEDYGISYEYFVVKDLMKNPTDEAFEGTKAFMEKRSDRYVEKLTKVTGMTEEEVIAETDRIKATYGFSLKSYYIHQLYKLTDEELAARKAEKEENAKRNLELIAGETGWEAPQIKKHMKHCRLEWGIDEEHYILFKAWQLTDEELATYVTIKTSRELNEKYNTKTGVLKNKVTFNKVFKNYIQRKFWVNEEGATFESFCEFTDGLDEIFCKPLDLSRGRGAERIKVQGDLRALYDELMARPQFLAEEFVKQHPKMNEVYDGSVNTIRMVNLMLDGEVLALSSFVRFGNGGVIDGLAGGGMIAAVDVNTGIVMTPALNGKGEVVERHPISGIPYVGFQIPRWDEVRSITERAMKRKKNLNYVGWDIAICEDKVVIIEGNATPDLGAYQCPFAPTKEGQLHLFTPYL